MLTKESFPQSALHSTSIGDRIKWIIERNNLSQNKLAGILGVSGASVSSIIKGRNNPDFKFIQNLLRHYHNLNADWLIHGVGPVYKSEDEDLNMVAEPQDFQYNQPAASQRFSRLAMMAGQELDDYLANLEQRLKAIESRLRFD